MKKTILIIDDDHDFVSMLSTFLEIKGFQVKKSYDWSSLPRNLEDLDLILLDINLPGKDGFEICENIRQKWNVPILFLSARINEQDKIKGLMLGGDDYITKPCSLDELYARIHTNITRNEREFIKKDVLIQDGICRINGQVIPLTKKEYDIVELLSSYPKQVFSKEKIYDILWSYDGEGDANVVFEHIRSVRSKFKNASDKNYIKTHWGMGYSWNG